MRLYYPGKDEGRGEGETRGIHVIFIRRKCWIRDKSIHYGLPKNWNRDECGTELVFLPHPLQLKFKSAECLQVYVKNILLVSRNSMFGKLCDNVESVNFLCKSLFLLFGYNSSKDVSRQSLYSASIDIHRMS